MDDAAGLLVARELRERLARGSLCQAHVLECAGGSFELIDLWAASPYVVLVDAVASGADPGTIFRFDAHDRPLPSSLFHYSTHGFNLADTVELARLLDKLPANLTVFGIEGAQFGAGEAISEDVAAAIHQMVETLVQHIQACGEASARPSTIRRQEA
jgi:hydrogenase maturation protease